MTRFAFSLLGVRVRLVVLNVLLDWMGRGRCSAACLSPHEWGHRVRFCVHCAGLASSLKSLTPKICGGGKLLRLLLKAPLAGSPPPPPPLTHIFKHAPLLLLLTC